MSGNVSHRILHVIFTNCCCNITLLTPPINDAFYVLTNTL